MTAAPRTHRPRQFRRGVAVVVSAIAVILPLATPAAAHTHASPRAAATGEPRVILASYRIAAPRHRPVAAANRMIGTASWYGEARRGFHTATGTSFDPDAMTAASHTLPLGTRVLVTIVGTARSVLVTITDRMQCATRVIDLSMGAARRIGMIAQGTARVTLRRV